ncbi:trimeric intracellular cation channel family protein [Advenella mimigardefordensis]|uniref:Putative membrane protein n=1 Tax=Advenella mimigardefordensis (strain DSM 17166 / LMG 22922 / DPN7) TaxID=1247726 RepID=W0PIF4_ADVMD|nr:trimeric intracellular cation channel family protein [Advenella mimigardefordensis]AHG65697.1 putative membrane protein [Advenella mimigardefordensis DPN7]
MIILSVLYIIAIVAESMTAALAAGRRNMDWVGVCLLGCVTALGGGSVRDIVLDHHPLSWVAHPHYLIITSVAALATIALARIMHRLYHFFLLLDAIGLVVFTIIGCNVALALELPLTVVIISGMLTGCVGGVLRDILCNDIPLLFRSELYASVSIVTGLLYVAGLRLNINHELVMAIALLAGLTLRMLALRFKWNMPTFIYNRDGH